MFWQILPWIVSCVTLTSMWLAGNKNPHAWTLGLLNQFMWCAIIIHAELWGLLPTTAGIAFIYTRNLLKWRADAHRVSEEHKIRQRVQRV